MIKRLQRGGLDARFERAEKLHVTLAFLGWVDPEQIEAVGDALARAASQCASFQMTLNKVGAFPHERRPRVVWIGSHTQGAAFRHLAETVRDFYQELGFAFDKPAVAHVTIARVKGGHAHLPALDLKPLKLRIGALTLFESIPAGPTTRYEVRARHPLKRSA
ncbi:MAG TPA: RNA 2',3'-cyclic phosphodiesterase [Candidatus Rubrimentiphilum sp.]|nr:RNA 2',3'-cyclic phosphodiesterase [Candidatus Rubrimentiphilum sp.]